MRGALSQGETPFKGAAFVLPARASIDERRRAARAVCLIAGRIAGRDAALEVLAALGLTPEVRP